MTEGIARQRMRVTVRMLGSLLLGGIAILGSVLVYRQGLLPLVDAAFQPGPEWLSAFRRAGILLSALAGYWAYVHWHEKREATELRVQPVHILLAGASGAGLLVLPIAVLFALGAYEMVLFRGASPALLGVAALIGIAATLEELVYRCLLFQLLERAWGTGVAMAAQSVLFALQHLGKRRARRNRRRGGDAGVRDFAGPTLGRSVRPGAQSVGSSRQSCGMELHHSSQRRAAFRHRGLARPGAT